jgi:hypothetical protein
MSGDRGTAGVAIDRLAVGECAGKTHAARLAMVMVEQFCATMKLGRIEIFDIGDTFCAAHGGQQLAFWNTHRDERGFATMHIYDMATGGALAPSGGTSRTCVVHDPG